MTSLPSSTLDGYDTLCLLGTGLTGRVNLCRDKASGKHYALKIMNKDKVRASNRIAQVFRERDALKLLGGAGGSDGDSSASCSASAASPFIIHLHGTFQDDESLYFVLTCAGGGDLYKHVRGAEGGAGLPLTTARFYAAEIVLALRHMHGSGLVYRDLKANNVVLDEQGHVLLCDFGFAKILRPAGADDAKQADGGGGGGGSGGGKEALRTHTYCGTPHAMAPEMVLREAGDGHGFEVDWWGLGVLLYEMIVGTAPFGYGGDDGGGGDGGAKTDAAEPAAAAAAPAPAPAPAPEATGVSASKAMVGDGTLEGRILQGADAIDFGGGAAGGKFAASSRLGEAAEGLIRDLLKTDPAARLGAGARGGATEIMAAKFFGAVADEDDAIDWEALAERRVDPPLFSRAFGEFPEEEARQAEAEPPIDQDLFAGF